MQAAEVRSQQLVKKRRVIQMVYCSSSIEGDGGREKMELGANEIATSSAFRMKQKGNYLGVGDK